MVRNLAHHTSEPKYLMDYKVLKIINDNTLLLIAPKGKESKTNINDVKPCSTTDLVENTLDLFLGSNKKQLSELEL